MVVLAGSHIIFLRFVKPSAGRMIVARWGNVADVNVRVGNQDIRRLEWLTNYQFSMFFGKILKRFCAVNKLTNPSMTPHNRVERWEPNGL